LAVTVLVGHTAHAQVTQQQYVLPQFLWHFYNVQDCGYCNHGPGPEETTLLQAWTDAQNHVNQCSGSGNPPPCYTAQNLHAITTTEFDSNPSQWDFDVQSCQSGSCQLLPNTGYIYTDLVCPPGASQGNYNSPNSNQLRLCSISIPTQMSPKWCLSCLGDPIYAGTGQNVQRETDYASPVFDYVRTYRSTLGTFSSITTTAFLDYSQTSGSPYAPCYASSWTYTTSQGTSSGPVCFHYVGSNQALYGLMTADGFSIRFSGPSSAITQTKDVDERVTLVNGQWQVRRADDTLEIYNAAGSLIQRTLRGGRTFTYTYSDGSTPPNIAPGPGFMLTESDAFGHTLSWQYDVIGRVSQMTDPAGAVYQYGYDFNSNVSGVIYPDQVTRIYEYNEPANTGGNNLPRAMTGITDESGVRFATFQYNSSGLAVSSQHAGGVDSYTFNYYSLNNRTYVTDPLGTTRTYQFQGGPGYLVDYSITQPAASGTGTVTEGFGHDANGNLSQKVDFNGVTSYYNYDMTRNLETTRYEAYNTANARTITTAWDAVWRQPDLITVYSGSSPTGTPLRKTSFTYDSNGNVLTKTITDTTVTPNATRTWTYTYDSYGRMLTATGPRTDVSSTTTYTYYTCTTGYQCGMLQTITDPVGNVTTYNTYNAHGQPLTITDPNGVVTTLTYDVRLRLTSRQVGSETTTFAYYPTGLLKQVTLPDSSFVQCTYDPAHRLTAITDGAGNYISYTLDAAGNRTAENAYDPSNTLHRTHTRAYNALNELSQDVNAAGTSAVSTTYAYDNNGNQTSISAPLSRNTTNAYDKLNRLNQVTDPASGITKFTYDANDNLLSVKDPRSLTTGYTYNGFGDLTQQVSPDTGTSANTYDSGGNLSVATDARGSSANYSYDASNRVTQILYKNGGATDQTLVFGYDAGTNGKGRLTSAGDGNHTLSWTYDALGRVIGKGQTAGTVTQSVGYGYTNEDLTALVTPSGQAIAYTYNGNHQVSGITVNGTMLLSNVTYEPFGGVNGWGWGSGDTVARTYNTDGLISQIVSASVTNAYTFDNANRITGISDSSNGALSWTYGYDALDRLTSATTSAITDGWSYDANGNRLTQTGTTPSTFAVAATSNQVTGTSGSLVRTYGYNAAGMTTGYTGTTFTYNNRGRMMGASTGSGSASYLYNALGQLVEKAASSTNLYVYDESGHILGEYDGSGNLIEETVWLGDIPVATLQPNGSGGINIFYVHTDHLNTPKKVTRPSDNALVWRIDQDPFGTASPNQNPSGLGTFTYNARFPGQLYMPETGLNQNYFRDYDPAVGRYLESDPIGLRAGINTYAYVRSQPVSLTDSTGLAIDPKQTCIEGLGIGCKGQQNNPNVPGTPVKPGKPDLPDKGYCAEHSINAQGCVACCTGIGLRNPVLARDWLGQCNAECYFRLAAACPSRRKDSAIPALLGGF
jgi:RHS repeat-associated protein